MGIGFLALAWMNLDSALGGGLHWWGIGLEWNGVDAYG